MTNLDEILTQIQHAGEARDFQKLAAACSQAGRIYRQREQYPEAAHYYREASLSFAENGHSLDQARALNHSSACLLLAGQPEQALETLQSAFNCLPDQTDSTLNAALLGNRGLAYAAQQDFTSAFKDHKSVLEIAEDLGDDHLRLHALINLADCRLQGGSFRSSQGFALVALDLAQELQPHPGMMIIHDLLGMLNARLGDLRTAAEHHQQAYQAALEFGDLRRQGNALANLGLALEGLTELEGAARAMEKAQKIFQTVDLNYARKISVDLERIYRGLGR